MWFPVFLAPLCLHVIRNLVGSYFQIFSPLGEINQFWNKHAFFRWFHVVYGVFGSIMLKAYKEPRWFPYHIFRPFSEINHFWNKSAFFRWFYVVPGVFGSFMSSFNGTQLVPIFRSSAHLGK